MREQPVLVGFDSVPKMTHRRLLMAVATVAICVTSGGCVNSSLRAARAEIEAGHYGPAHQDLVAAERSGHKLSPREKREIIADLCLTEYQIGMPAYPLAQQERACTIAARESDADSAALLVKVQERERTSLAGQIDAALVSGDAAEAEAGIVRYKKVPGKDPQAVTRWSKQLWELVNRNDSAEARKHDPRLAPVILRLTQEYSELQTISESAFKRWIEAKTTIDGTKMVDRVVVGRNVLDLWVPGPQMPTAALNLDRFAHINDAMVARCHCSAKTNVASEESGLPAYIVRLDTETSHSQVLILARPR